jgi:protease II
VTAGVVKVTPTWFGQTDATLVILAGVAGKRVSDTLRVDVPPHAFTAVTDSVPVVNVLGTLNTIELPLLVTIVQPAGTDQL